MEKKKLIPYAGFIDFFRPNTSKAKVPPTSHFLYQMLVRLGFCLDGLRGLGSLLNMIEDFWAAETHSSNMF